MTSLLGDGVRLTLVLGHVGVDCADEVWTDRRLEDCRQLHGRHDGVLLGED